MFIKLIKIISNERKSKLKVCQHRENIVNHLLLNLI